MMTHKQECICYCIDHLNSRNLFHVYNAKLFDHYYRKNNGFYGNAFAIGIKAADFMINNYEPKNINQNERGNENETSNTERA